jgi:hypothetical protein
MNNTKKIIRVLTSQIKVASVKLPQIPEKTPTIQDNNQSIHNGVINEANIEFNLRGEGQSKKRGRPKKLT